LRAEEGGMTHNYIATPNGTNNENGGGENGGWDRKKKKKVEWANERVCKSPAFQKLKEGHKSKQKKGGCPRRENAKGKSAQHDRRSETVGRKRKRNASKSISRRKTNDQPRAGPGATGAQGGRNGAKLPTWTENKLPKEEGRRRRREDETNYLKHKKTTPLQIGRTSTVRNGGAPRGKWAKPWDAWTGGETGNPRPGRPGEASEAGKLERAPKD